MCKLNQFSNCTSFLLGCVWNTVQWWKSWDRDLILWVSVLSLKGLGREVQRSRSRSRLFYRDLKGGNENRVIKKHSVGGRLQYPSWINYVFRVEKYSTIQIFGLGLGFERSRSRKGWSRSRMVRSRSLRMRSQSRSRMMRPRLHHWWNTNWSRHCIAIITDLLSFIANNYIPG